MTDTPARSAKRPSRTKRMPGGASVAEGRGSRKPVHAQHDELPTHLRPYRLYLKTAQLPQRVRIEREGVPSQVVEEMIDEFGISTTAFQLVVGIPAATYKKRIKEKGLFSGTSGQSVVGLMDLINQVEDMLAAEPDNPDAQGFDVAAWVGHWIQRPQKALGGLAPSELLDTPSGRESVMRVLGAIQSGAYQ
jgi:uncharacterized protein (DUF2384 family)